ncbi:hypothetical protein LTR47_000349 [Exophiala xenobiotica]|nr:hypothetical protein LTR41_004126 [Exophiala xenobiotica]KAK5238606.1 hypothetical protein LTR47_000349 [Exophiala xenobiotica]KAK5302240.1 hypothetical protein LTR14_000489 [Exophiala xenobiotica]KAK5350034.1 hypothetical protein LTR61_006009 [Exophiala xenobiotica]KAK5387413.1 hypothetical protein LTR11_001078 [Exophiala xenobiotica]
MCQNCITGSHILHYHGILDAFGHLSFRHPTRRDVFIMPRNLAPANIASPEDDLVEYNVSDASPVDSTAPAGYIERYIHSEIYKQYPGVNSVIHSHASAVVPYTISGVPLKPCLHMAGFLGASTPVYDIAKHYEPGATRDLLIRSPHLGESLAACFRAADASTTQTSKDEPDHSVVLMRGHGYTVAARSIEECVFRAIYTRDNATIQTASLGLSAAYRGTGDSPTEIQYLRDDEIEGATGIALTGWARAWGLWVREVEAANLYASSG